MSGDKLDYQIAPFSRFSETKFTPDPVGDLVFNGVADRSQLSSWSSGVQADAKYTLSDSHTLRAGLFFSAERTISQVTSDVFQIDSSGNQLTDIPSPVLRPERKDRLSVRRLSAGRMGAVGCGDDHFGGRFDIVNAYTNENQISPRINLVWKIDPDTTFHTGYARNFTPPPAGAGRQPIDRPVHRYDEAA